MSKQPFKYTDWLYKKLKSIWENKKTFYLISILLVVGFIFCSLLSVLVINDIIYLGIFHKNFQNPFFSIEIIFTILLITELLSLIFVLPKSVAQSVGKQFELLSLIFLRDSFKEFSHILNFDKWDSLNTPLTYMLVYAFGAITIFAILGFNYKLQKHIKLTHIEDDQEQFISQKKIISLFLFIAFFLVGFNDMKTLFTTGVYLHSFTTFYTILIFSDILIVLIALRYTLNYYKIFRYSAFVLATVLIKVALSSPPHYDVPIGVLASFFILSLTISYNYFLRDLPQERTKT